ncbi:MAG: hypothetical protein PVH67_07265 [Desulfobacterales bacterium]
MKLPQINPLEVGEHVGSYKQKVCPSLAGLPEGGLKFLSPSSHTQAVCATTRISATFYPDKSGSPPHGTDKKVFCASTINKESNLSI